MNKVQMVGRLTRDPESHVSGETAIAKFSIAVNRKFKRDGDTDADFFNCVAFGKTGEFVNKYFTKGMAIGISGRLTTGSYVNKEGQKVYTTDIVVEEAEFVEKKSVSAENAAAGATMPPLPPQMQQPQPQAMPPQYQQPAQAQPQYQMPPVQQPYPQAQPQFPQYQQMPPQYQQMPQIFVNVPDGINGEVEFK